MIFHPLKKRWKADLLLWWHSDHLGCCCCCKANATADVLIWGLIFWSSAVAVVTLCHCRSTYPAVCWCTALLIFWCCCCKANATADLLIRVFAPLIFWSSAVAVVRLIYLSGCLQCQSFSPRPALPQPFPVQSDFRIVHIYFHEVESTAPPPNYGGIGPTHGC